MSSRVLGPEGGFTLAEILTATAVVAIGLGAAAVAFQYAISGLEAGRGESTATFLAEQKLEELKAVALVDWANAALVPSTTIEYCRSSGDSCTATPTPGSYRRATTVADSSGGTCITKCKIVRVAVFYRSISGEGQFDQERRIDISTIFAARA